MSRESNKFFYNIKLLMLFSFIISGCSNLDVQTLNNKAAELMSKGDVDGAISRLIAIQDLNPNFPQTNYNLGIAYKEKKDYNKALNYLNKAAMLKPNMFQAHIAISVINEELANQTLSMELDKLQKQNPNKTINTSDLNLSASSKQKVLNYFIKAKAALEDFIKYSPNNKKNQEYTLKLNEYNQYISQFSSEPTKEPLEPEKKATIENITQQNGQTQTVTNNEQTQNASN